MDASFCGRHYSGRGDIEYLELLDQARRMFTPDPRRQNVSMLYHAAWNGFVEGPKWDAWWIQNSYGTTYSALPFYQEPYTTFLQNAHDLWFDQMGDGRRTGGPNGEAAPDGSLCDTARPGMVIYKQGDGRTDIHDWGLEFTAAGVVLQAELLLISRDPAAIGRYLPKLERALEFLDTRRDPRNGLLLAGPAANLLAPSYAGIPQADGSFKPGYLAGLAITYLAALERVVELEKLRGDTVAAARYAQRAERVRAALPLLCTPEGYFVKALDPDGGAQHGVYGQAQFGYFESSPNHDAIALRIADDDQAKRIYAKIAAIPELRPHGFMITNYPSLDDMYETAGIFRFGTWVNGGHWSTCEARAILAYCRLGRFDDVRRSWRQLEKFARAFRLDNPLTEFGDEVWFKDDPIHLCYDSLGPAAAVIRGLFEYLYRADGLTLIPHIPETINELHQWDPIRFGSKQLYLSTYGAGPIAAVTVNDVPWAWFDQTRVDLPYAQTPAKARIVIRLGDAPSDRPTVSQGKPLASGAWSELPPRLARRAQRMQAVHERLAQAGLGASYEAAHAQLVVDAVDAVGRRRALLAAGQLEPLPKAAQAAADRLYADTAIKLCEGLESVLQSYEGTGDVHKQQVRAVLGG